MSRRLDQKIAIEQAARGAEQVFALHQWTWTDDNGVKYVPTVQQIEETFSDLLEGLRADKQWQRGTGRLLVEKDELHGWSFLVRLGDLSTDEDGN